MLYVNFKKPSHADDSELTDDDVIIRYEKGLVVGMTFLHARKNAWCQIEPASMPGCSACGPSLRRMNSVDACSPNASISN